MLAPCLCEFGSDVVRRTAHACITQDLTVDCSLCRLDQRPNVSVQLTRRMRNPSYACRLLDALAVELGVSPLDLLGVRQPERTHGSCESTASATATDPPFPDDRSIAFRRRRSVRSPTAELETRSAPDRC